MENKSRVNEMNLKSNVNMETASPIGVDLEQVANNVQNLQQKPINPDDGWITAYESPQVMSGLDALKMKVEEDLGIKDKLDTIDNGLLSPNTFGYVGGGMTSRLVEYGKQQYLANRQKQLQNQNNAGQQTK